MFFYARIADSDELAKVTKVFTAEGGTTKTIFVDDSLLPIKESENYKILKNRIKKGDVLTLDTIFSVGANCKEIYEELLWFTDHGITVRILDMPSFIRPTSEANYAMLDLLKSLSKNNKG